MLKRLILGILKPLSFVPMLAMMVLIFTFSSQSGVDSGQLSHRVSCKIVEVGGRILDKPLEDWQIEAYADKIEHLVRKGGPYDRIFCSCHYGGAAILCLWPSGFPRFCWWPELSVWASPAPMNTTNPLLPAGAVNAGRVSTV